MGHFSRGAGNNRGQRGLFTNNSDLVVSDFDLGNHGAEIGLLRLNIACFEFFVLR